MDCHIPRNGKLTFKKRKPLNEILSAPKYRKYLAEKDTTKKNKDWTCLYCLITWSEDQASKNLPNG